jgi:hypothetical protein
VPSSDSIDLGIDLGIATSSDFTAAACPPPLTRRPSSSSPRDELARLAARVDQLGRANRWHSGFSVVCFLVAVFAGISSHGANLRLDFLKHSVQTEEIIVSDNNGSMCTIGSEGKGPHIAFRDTRDYLGSKVPGSRRLVMGVNAKNHPYLLMLNRGAEDSTDKPGPIANLLMVNDTSSSLQFNDKEGRFGTSVGVSKDGSPRHELSDRDGNNRILLGVKPDGSPLILLSGDEEKSRMHLGVSPANEPYLVLMRPDGSVSFQAPEGFVSPSPHP